MMMRECFRRLGLADPARVVKVDDTEPGLAEGVAAGCLTVGVALSGNHAGLSPEAVAAHSEADRAALRDRVGALLRAGGADHVIDTVADLPALLASLDA